MSLTLRNVCSLIVFYVDHELLTKYFPDLNQSVVSNRIGLQSVLHNVVGSLNTIAKDDEVEHKIYFLKLCALLFCDNKTSLDLKQLIMRRIIPKISLCIVNADYAFLKEIWLFCIHLSRSDSRQQQAVAYLLLEQMLHLYAPSVSGDPGSFEIRIEFKLEGFLIRGLTFPPSKDGLALSVFQAALNITKQIVSFKQPYSSSNANNFLWSEGNEVEWCETWKSYIELCELMGEAEELTKEQIRKIEDILILNNNSPYLGMRWVACLIQRGLGNIHANVRISILHAILASTNLNPDFDFFVLYELPSLLDHDYLYSVNEEDPLQCPFGLEVSHIYYKFLQQGDRSKKRNFIRAVIGLLADFTSAKAILFFAHALHRVPRFPLMNAETHKNLRKIPKNKAFCKGGDAEELLVHCDLLLLEVFFKFIDNTSEVTFLDAMLTLISVTMTMNCSIGTPLCDRMQLYEVDHYEKKENKYFR